MFKSFYCKAQMDLTFTGAFTEKVGSVSTDAKKLDTGSRDAISSLPREVLGDILSLVPTKLAVSTSVLSKKWRDMFAFAHHLDFDDSDFLQPEEGKEERDEIRESFRTFVDRTLAVQCGSPINKFSLKCHVLDDSDMAHVSRWICNAVQRGVSEVDLSLNARVEVYLPAKLFTSKKLVKLTLGTQVSLGKIPTDVSLPALKSLSIDSVFFTIYDLSDVLLPACPVLEELSILHGDFEGHPYCISSRSIKKLSVRYYCEFYLRVMTGMSFDTPSLVSLDYSDHAMSVYTPLNLESLVEARLDICYSPKREPDVSALLIGMSNVETLHLSPASADVISRCVNQGLTLPVFNNLVNLSFGSDSERGLKLLLPYLLKQSPKLETLIIQGLDVGYTGDVVKSIGPSKVKVLHVLGFGGTAKEWEHVKRKL
ncbi:unnamed protein product [Microthlaspi erraticum]|uniref:Uncharacterized protein n=1 Tax=Microthlaspi erraticum TaxID=1685480 RepID=A0A6D2HS99_9BRAS|nr:unnamed protein product [Microthlaspi erraticum]